MTWGLLQFILWLACGATSATIAHRRVDRGDLGFWLGILLGPFGIAAAFFLRRKPRARRSGAYSEGGSPTFAGASTDGTSSSSDYGSYPSNGGDAAFSGDFGGGGVSGGWDDISSSSSESDSSSSDSGGGSSD